MDHYGGNSCDNRIQNTIGIYSLLTTLCCEEKKIIIIKKIENHFERSVQCQATNRRRSRATLCRHGVTANVVKSQNVDSGRSLR